MRAIADARGRRRFTRCFICLICLWFVPGVAPATDTRALPKVVVLGTGGTIAGSAAVSTDMHEYDPGKVPVQALIDGLPGLRDAVDVRSEQLFQLGSAERKASWWSARAEWETAWSCEVQSSVMTNSDSSCQIL